MGIFVFIAGCDTVPVVRSDIPWMGSKINQDCVRKAIEGTPGITFERQEARMSTGFCAIGECGMKFFTIFYTVNSNTKYKQAFVRFTESNKGRISVEDLAVGTVYEGLPPNDRAGFEKAQMELGAAISKECPEAAVNR
jgi:hypothetical protein